MLRTVVATVAAVTLFAAFAPRAAAAEQYQIDPIHSVIIFKIKHMDVGYFYGRFNSPQGNFTFDEANPAASSFQAQVKAADFDSGNTKRDDHVRGPDFLSAKEFPTVGFRSTSVESAGTGRYKVAGQLTLHGVTKPVTMSLEKTGANKDRVGFEGVMDIKRSDFGMKGVQGVSDEIRLTVAFQGVKKAG